MILLLLILYTILFVALMATTSLPQFRKFHTRAKLLNSLGFIMVAVIGTSISNNYMYLWGVLPGLVFCLTGDVFLALKDTKTHSETLFIAGLGSFLVGHICFLIFIPPFRVMPVTAVDFIIPIGMTIVALLLTFLPDMDVKNMRPCILVYAFFLASLLSRSLRLVSIDGWNARNGLLLIGSALFMISDIIILFLYFYNKKYKLGGFLNLSTYYYGLFLIALSTYFS